MSHDLVIINQCQGATRVHCYLELGSQQCEFNIGQTQPVHSCDTYHMIDLQTYKGGHRTDMKGHCSNDHQILKPNGLKMKHQFHMAHFS